MLGKVAVSQLGYFVLESKKINYIKESKKIIIEIISKSHQKDMGTNTPANHI